MSAPTLEVRKLEVSLAGGATIVEPLDLALAPGEILGLVGESGSGKTTAGLALLGFTQPGVRIAGGSVRVAGEELVGRAETELRALRGRVVSYVPQDPSTSLNPALRVDRHLVELLRVHSPARADDATICAALESVGLPSDVGFRRRFPHQLSGGQQQRLAIAMALICRPSVAILDEPTTGLDVLTQARILAEVTRLRDETGVAIVYVSHDLAVVSGIADRIAVMYAGSIVEQGPAAQVLEQPRHPYTHGLVSSIPDHVTPRRLRGVKGIAVGVGDRPHGCAFAPRCALRTTRCELEAPPAEATSPGHVVRCFEFARTPPLRFEALPHLPQSSNGVHLLETRDLHAGHRTRNGFVTAAAGVDLSLAPGECVALVGESGSGKTTIARTVAGLHEPSGGEILLAGEPLAPRARARTREQRRRIQIVFQNPYESLNPRMTVAHAIGDPMRFLGGVGKASARARVTELLELVRLPPGVASRWPRELSGGERQRVAIARALAPEPDVLVCDEITSALDVSVQAAVLDLLLVLRRELGLALLFITHDLGVVASVADRVLVLDRGQLCEVGPVANVLGAPQAPYTRELLAAAPRLPALPAA